MTDETPAAAFVRAAAELTSAVAVAIRADPGVVRLAIAVVDKDPTLVKDAIAFGMKYPDLVGAATRLIGTNAAALSEQDIRRERSTRSPR